MTKLLMYQNDFAYKYTDILWQKTFIMSSESDINMGHAFAAQLGMTEYDITVCNNNNPGAPVVTVVEVVPERVCPSKKAKYNKSK